MLFRAKIVEILREHDSQFVHYQFLRVMQFFYFYYPTLFFIEEVLNQTSRDHGFQESLALQTISLPFNHETVFFIHLRTPSLIKYVVTLSLISSFLHAFRDIFMEKHWKSVVSRSVCDYFFNQQRNISNPEDVPPVISTPHHYLISIYRSSLFFIVVCMTEGKVEDRFKSLSE